MSAELHGEGTVLLINEAQGMAPCGMIQLLLMDTPGLPSVHNQAKRPETTTRCD